MIIKFLPIYQVYEQSIELITLFNPLSSPVGLTPNDGIM